MSQLLFKIVTFVMFMGLFMSASNVKGVYFAEDTVILYENGERINDSNLIVGNSNCKEGICSIGQQFYPVTIYRTKSGTLTSSQISKQILEQDPYPEPPAATEGMTTSEWQGALSKWSAVYDQWNKRTSDNYIKYLEENSEYHVSFNPGPSSGGNDGRIGTPRLYILEVTTGKYQEISVYVVACFVILLVASTALLYFVRKRMKGSK